MDAKLAEAYKTNQADETDTEALAMAALAEKLAASDEINVDGMSDDEAEALASEILGTTAEETPEEPAAEETPEEEGEKTAEEQELTPEQEKIAEADYLGRVMAHAYAAERREIEKNAGKLDNLKGAAAMAGAAASKHKDKAVGAAKAGAGKVMEHVKKHKSGYGAAAGGAAAAGMFGAGRMSKKDKKASAEEAPAQEEQQVSALDQLAVARAEEILKEHGYEAPADEQEKKSSIDEDKAAQLAAKVEERAMAMIADAGIELEKVEETPAEEDKA